MAQHVIKKVADAYNSGKKEHRKGAAPRSFRWQSAQPFDARNLSFQLGTGTVSIATTAGRCKNVPFKCSPEQLLSLQSTNKIGESDLIYRGGALYLYCTIDVDEAECNQAVGGWVGVDLGIVNIATSSMGHRYSGKHRNHVRNRNLRLRRKLQKKGTKSAHRLLSKRSGVEARFSKDVNHCISKQIVAEAQRTGRGIALEDLVGIRERVRSRKPQRAALHSWSFAQLGSFIVYKAKRVGVPVVFIDPAYTSQQCFSCKHIDKRNRKTQSDFCCTGCGFVDHADRNASNNIAHRGEVAWAVSHAAERGIALAV